MLTEWKEIKKEIEREITDIEKTIKSGNYNTDEVKLALRSKYEELIKINNFVKFTENKIKNLVKEIKSNTNDSSNLQSFVQSMKIAPVDLTTFTDKGWNFMVEEQYDDAVNILRKANKLAPNDIKTMNLLGWAYIHKKEFDNAMMVFQDVLNKEPNNNLAKNNLGFVCFKKGIYGEAIEHLSGVLRSAKDRMSLIYANFYLGLIYFEREMYDDALRFFRRTKKIAPNHMESFYYEGKSLLEMGKKNKAKNIFESLINKNKYNKWAQRAEELLNELNGEKNEEEN